MPTPYQQLHQSITQLHPQLTPQEWTYLSSITTQKEYSKKDYIIQYGSLQQHLYFVTQGLVRGFYINEKGEEITIRFAQENGYVTHYTALLSQQPSQYYFQCLEPTKVLQLQFAGIQEGYHLHKGLERFGRLIAEQILKGQQKRIEGFQFLTAEARYLQFVEEYPQLFNRVSLSHLASYLGIQRPSLSRIRKKLALG